MYHRPVLLQETIELLDIRPGGTYVDATFGSGGHSLEILNKLDRGRLLSFDQDKDAQQNIFDDERFTFIPQNFRYLKNFLKTLGILSVDGILADLGISSWQIDRPERGFSTRHEAPLDMRMDRDQDVTAISVLNDYSEEELCRIFIEYGEISHAHRLVREIIRRRSESRINTTSELNETATLFAPKGKENQFLAKVFQAIRIEVNEELESLKDLLHQSLELLNPHGRIAIISYHSLEDRLVKNFFNTGNFKGDQEKDFYGNPLSPLSPVTRKAIQPTKEEIQINPRSRSAKLRVAEKKQ